MYYSFFCVSIPTESASHTCLTESYMGPNVQISKYWGMCQGSSWDFSLQHGNNPREDTLPAAPQRLVEVGPSLGWTLPK